MPAGRTVWENVDPSIRNFRCLGEQPGRNIFVITIISVARIRDKKKFCQFLNPSRSEQPRLFQLPC
jgi:hypothetical protein